MPQKTSVTEKTSPSALEAVSGGLETYALLDELFG